MIESFSSNQESYFALGFCLLQPDFMPYEHDRPDGKFLPGARSFAKIQLGTTEGYTTADDQEHVAGSLMFLTSGLQRVLSDTPGIPEGLKVSNEDNRFLIIRNCDGDQVLSCHPQTAYVLHSFVELVSEMDVTESRIMARRFGVSSEILDSILPDSMEVFARNLREDIDISFTAHVILKRELKWGVYDTLGRQFVDSVLNNRQLEETVAES